MTRQQQRILSALVVLGCLAMAPPGEAAKNRWSSQGPFGGSVKALVVDPNDAQTVYAGIDGNGIFKTDDGGVSWVEVGGGPGDPFAEELDRVQALAFDNQVPQANLYAGTNGDGVFRSADAGATWTPVNGESDGDPANDLQNKAVVSLAIHPDVEQLDSMPEDSGLGLIFAGTNGGGVFRGVYDFPLAGDVAWDDENAGLGNRVIFDLEIPEPQSPLVINEVDAKMPGEAAEFIELFGPANAPLAGLVVVLYDAGIANEPSQAIPCPDPSDFDGEFAYAAWDLDDPALCPPGGCFLDNTGFFVLGDVGAGVEVDYIAPGFSLLNTGATTGSDSAAVALYFGDTDDFIPNGNPTTDGLIDVIPYNTGGGTNDVCFNIELGVGSFDHANEGGSGGTELNSVSRLPDGGLRRDPDRFGSAPITPGIRNVRLRLLYAATDLEGVYRSTDLFAEPNLAWAPINNGLTSDVVFSLGVDPVDPDVLCPLSSFTIYAGTSGQGVFRSTDPCDLDLEEDWFPVGPLGATVTAMAVAPVIDPLSGFESAVYAGTELGEVYKTTDEGDTWSLRSNGLGGLRVDSLLVEPTIYGSEDPLRPSRVYAGTLGGGVYKTIDSGSNWFVTAFDLAGIIGVFAQDVEIVQEQPWTTLYAATFGGGVWRSDDNGENWLSLPTSPPPPGMELGSSFVNTLVIDPGNPLALWVGTDLAGGFESADGGETWTPLSGPIADESSVLQLVMDPGEPLTLWAVTGVLYRSTDGGTTWVRMVNSGPDPGSFNDSAVQTVTVDPTDSSVVFVGTQNRGLWRSDDADEPTPNWFRVGQASLTEDFIRTVAVDPGTPATVYAGTDGGGVFKSVDGGNVWVPQSNGLPDNLIVLALRFDLEDFQILYAGTDGNDPVGGGVFKTIDGGSNWAPFNTNITNFVIKDLEIAPRLVATDSQFLHAASFGGGVFDFEKEELFVIEPQTGLITTEAGGTDTFAVSLARIPFADVIFQLESSDSTEGVVEPTALLFTPTTADIPQFVTVTGLPDGDPIDGDVPYSVVLKPVSSDDPGFDGVDPDNVSVTNLNIIPPEPGVIVLPSNLVTTEDGGTATFEVILRSTPSAAVNISLTSSDPGEGFVEPTVLIFTPGNADIPQEATVTGVQDGTADGDQEYLILTEATSADPDYNDREVPDVSVVNRDNGLSTLFETALLGETGQPVAGGWVISDRVYLGAKFTVPELLTVRNFGGHVVADGADPSIFVAIVPLAGDDFPPDFAVEDDAVFGTSLTAPAASAEVAVQVDLVLQPGRYAVIFGSGEFGATGRGRMPGNDANIGEPEYFFSDHAVPVWEDSDGPEDLDSARFFINGIVGRPPAIFADGFESGSTSAWSAVVE